MAKHTLLSASASKQWLNCPPSARLCAEESDRASPYAKEGSDAHALCEAKVLTALGRSPNDPTENLDYYDAEMEDCATEYKMSRLNVQKILYKNVQLICRF